MIYDTEEQKGRVRIAIVKEPGHSYDAWTNNPIETIGSENKHPDPVLFSSIMDLEKASKIAKQNGKEILLIMNRDQFIELAITNFNIDLREHEKTTIELVTETPPEAAQHTPRKTRLSPSNLAKLYNSPKALIHQFQHHLHLHRALFGSLSFVL